MADADTDAEVDDTDADAGTDAGSSNAGESEEISEELVARIATVDEELAADVGAKLERLGALEEELTEKDDRIEELESSLKRTKADFQNYKKRSEKRKEEIKERATEDLIERLIDVRDNLVRALEQDDDADIRDGVEATLSTFDRVLDDENVEAIHPDPGTEVDPEVHEVMMQVESDEPPGTVADVYRPGYRMAGKVLQAAQVTVSEPEPDGSTAGDEDATGDDAAE